MTDNKLTHLDKKGRARMVDISEKGATRRTAEAAGRVIMNPETLRLITDGDIPKGDVLAVARIAGIQAAKRTWELIPLCHPLALDSVTVDFIHDDEGVLEITASVHCTGRTGAEMEAMTAVSAAALTIYDMCKAVDKAMEITGIYLLKKTGGKSGEYFRSK